MLYLGIAQHKRQLTADLLALPVSQIVEIGEVPSPFRPPTEANAGRQLAAMVALLT